MYLRLLPLALATFAVGTDGFVIAGLLPAIATDLDVTIPAAGQLVSAFALTLAIAAPVLGAATSTLDRRAALLLALGVFTAGNALTALADSYGLALASRVLTAAGAGIINSAAASTAAVIAPPERRGRALSFVMGGLMTATALGLPLGTLIGGADWRLALWAVAGLGLVSAAGIALGLPAISLPAAGLRDRIAPLRRPEVIGIVLVTGLAMVGMYVLYPYIAPALAGVTGGSPVLLTTILFVWGLGTVAGNLLVGRLSDRHAPQRLLLAGLAASALLLAITPLVATHLASTLVWAALWGIAVGFPVVPQQHRLVALAPSAGPVLLGLNSASIYAGIALGGALGGLLQNWMTPVWLGLPGAVALLVAAALTVPAVRGRAAVAEPVG
ncbi:MFS transporter [Saccharopolyspora taberi]|uniref:MFS transporter n=1 Tax=Saccharopolyspora taberi TaxID=60895 RepID=A0ABN3V1X9_9PSEU